MKRILFIFISFLFYMDGMAQETQIQLYKENVDDWVKDDRSLPIMPTATHDGNIISIYSDMPIEKLEIAIKDTYKNIIHSAIIIGYSKCHTFELPRLPKGKYTIELTIGEESLDTSKATKEQNI